jgi:DNA (cytosine-5)-methyltransferase 1
MTAVTVGSLFSGVGGLDLAVEEFFGARTVWHCEYDKEPSKVLAARWPGVPNLGDITAVDWATVEPVDIMCGGFPCQDLSLSGRRAGMRPGTRSGLWSDFVKAITALRPSVVIIENVRGLLSGCAESDSDMEPCPRCVDDGCGKPHAPRLRALGRVLGDLDSLGFDAEWVGLPASSVGAPHGRFRVFVLAYARGVRLGEGWHTAPGQAEGGWASAITRRRSGAPVDRPLLRTPVADELGGGPLHPDVAKERGQTLRLSGQVLALTGNLLPRASRGASGTETMYALGAARDDEGDRQGNVVGQVSWGEYEPAVRLWESLTRPAPAPTLPDGKNGNHRLNAEFTSWMMGYPAGWMTDILTRNPAIKACGNGVVPQQAYAALDVLWSRALEWAEVAA